MDTAVGARGMLALNLAAFCGVAALIAYSVYECRNRHLHSQSRFVSGVIAIFNYVILNWLLDIVFYHTAYARGSSTYDILISVLTLALTIFQSCYCFKFTLINYTQYEIYFLRMGADRIICCLQLGLRYAIAWIYALSLKPGSDTIVSQNVLVVIFGLLELLSFYLKIPYAAHFKNKVHLFLLGLFVLQSVQGLLWFTLGAIEASTSVLLLLLLQPVTFELLLRVYKAKFYREVVSMGKMAVYLSRFIESNSQSFQLDQLSKMLLIAVTQHHKNSCHQYDCECKKMEMLLKSSTQRVIYNLDLIRHILEYQIKKQVMSNQFVLRNQDQFLQNMVYLVERSQYSFSLHRIIELQDKEIQLNTHIRHIQLSVKPSQLFQTCLEQISVYIKRKIQISAAMKLQSEKIVNTIKMCSLYFQIEQEKLQNAQILQELLLDRLSNYRTLQSEMLTIDQLIRLNQHFYEKVSANEKRLTKFYEKIPTKETQNMLCFFFVEVKGDLKRARAILKSNPFAQNLQMNNLFRNCIFNVFQPEVFSLVTSYKDLPGNARAFLRACQLAQLRLQSRIVTCTIAHSCLHNRAQSLTLAYTRSLRAAAQAGFCGPATRWRPSSGTRARYSRTSSL